MFSMRKIKGEQKSFASAQDIFQSMTRYRMSEISDLSSLNLQLGFLTCDRNHGWSDPCTLKVNVIVIISRNLKKKTIQGSKGVRYHELFDNGKMPQFLKSQICGEVIGIYLAEFDCFDFSRSQVLSSGGRCLFILFFLFFLLLFFFICNNTSEYNAYEQYTDYLQH